MLPPSIEFWKRCPSATWSRGATHADGDECRFRFHLFERSGNVMQRAILPCRFQPCSPLLVCPGSDLAAAVGAAWQTKSRVSIQVFLQGVFLHGFLSSFQVSQAIKVHASRSCTLVANRRSLRAGIRFEADNG